MYGGDQMVPIARDPYDYGIYLQTTEMLDSNGKEQLQTTATTANISYPFGNMVTPAEGGPSIKLTMNKEWKRKAWIQKKRKPSWK